MGSYNSKDESPNAEDSPLNEETLVQIFEYVESLNDLTKVPHTRIQSHHGTHASTAKRYRSFVSPRVSSPEG